MVVHTVLRWLIGMMVGVLVIVTGACSDESREITTNIPPARDTRQPEPEPSAVYDEKKLDLARHAILQLHHFVNDLNFSLVHRLDERMAISNEGDALIFGCRLINKISPPFERDFDASVEELRVHYVKCEPSKLTSQNVIAANMSGQSVHTIVYDKPYPRLGAQDMKLGYPVYIGQRTGPLNIVLNHASGLKTRIARIARLSANRVENNDTESVFRLSGEITDVYSQERADGPKNGRIRIELGDVMVRMSKSTRRVASLKIGSLTLKARPEGIQLSRGARSLSSSASSWQDESIELVIVVPEVLSPDDSACKPIPGKFQIYVGGNLMGALNVADSKIAFEDQDAKEFKLCESEEEVFYTEEFERIF